MLNKILRNERGVALMMIMTAIMLLMAVYGEFTFESKISRIKATNILDRSQAKLLAESGLQLAMGRLRLYKEAYNKIQSNPDAKNMVPAQLLNQLWEVPFIFPVPVTDNANRAFKDTVEKFTKETFLEGQMKVSIQNISNRLNLNMLRVDMTKYNPDASAEDGQDTTSALDMSDNAIQTNVSIDQSLFFIMKRLIDEKKEKDEGFAARYSNVNYQEMITALKFFMSDYQSMNQDPLAGESESKFQQIPLSPKYGPLGSASEIFSIPGWNDELIELIQNEFSVYPTTQVDFNKLTANMLKIFFPNLTDDQIKEFFLWRDEPDLPKQINSKEDLKKYFVTQERIMSDTDFDNRLKLFEDKGMTFGSNPNLFKIISEGSYNRANFTLVALVVLPKNEITPPKCPTGQVGTPPACRPRTEDDPPETTPTTPATTNPPNQSAQLLEPRVIEIQIN